MKEINLKKRVLLLFIILLGISFYQYAFIVQYSSNFKIIGVSLIFVIIIFGKKNRYPKLFKKPLQIYFFGIFLSTIFCYLFWGQSVITSFMALKSYYFMLLYFALHYLRPSLKDVHFVIIAIAMGYMTFYMVNFLLYPIMLFGDHGVERRGTLSFTFFGVIFMIYTLFYSFHKLTIKLNIKHFVLLIFCLLILILRASRSAIFAVCFCLLFYYLLKTAWSTKKIFFIVFFLILFSFVYVNFNTIFDALIDKTTTDLDDGDDYVRVKSAYYYLFEHSPSIWNNIFGNGWFSSYSDYGEYMVNVMWGQKKLYGEDVGLIGFWSYFGVITITAYFVMIFRLFKKYNSIPLRMFGVYLILNSFGTMDSYMQDSLILQPILFYISDLNFYKHKIKYENKIT
jgi:hypothetical protein